jgi:hypothetical protein
LIKRGSLKKKARRNSSDTPTDLGAIGSSLDKREERLLLMEKNKAMKLQLQSEKMDLMKARHKLREQKQQNDLAREENDRKQRELQQQTQNDLVKALLGRLNK